MGTDRFEYDRQVCECGEGRFVIDRCEPSFGWADASNRWFEGRVECRNCAGIYEIVQQDNAMVVVTRSDIEEQQRQRDEASEASRGFMARSEVQAVLRRFGEKLDSFRSKAEVYRYLKQLGFNVQSQSSFSSKWRGGASWAAGWRNEYDVERALAGLGDYDAHLVEEIARIRGTRPYRTLTAIRELKRVS
jgi:hypothetical protein